MTPRDSTIRLTTYVNAAVLSAFIGGVSTVDFTDWKQVAVFSAAVLLAGNNALRAYIDKTPAEVQSSPLPSEQSGLGARAATTAVTGFTAAIESKSTGGGDALKPMP
jgi:hypothetical protein